MSKIESLTPEQEAQMDVYRDKWIKIGLSTEPLDLENAKKAAIKAYELAGLPAPTQFFTAKSPVDAIRLIKELDPEQDSNKILGDMSYGCHDAPWLSFYDYFKTCVGVEGLEQIEGLTELAYHCGWVSFYEDVVVFQDRPCTIKMDEQNRTHCEDGPAIAYSDGFAIYVWHGVTIHPEWITNKSALTPKIALTWENIEQRRCACEILGWVHILKELNAKTIDTDDDPMVGTLVEVTIPDIGKEKFLKVLCGTGREFAIPVPPEMKTALEANAWTYDIPADMLRQLEVRT